MTCRLRALRAAQQASALTPLPGANGNPDVIDRAEWASRISASWRASVEAVLETGRILIAAKAALPHGSFQAMVEADLPFGTSAARQLMAIAKDGRIAKRECIHVLPPSWGTLYELTKLDDGQFEAALSAGIIRPDMQRKDLAPLRAKGPIAGTSGTTGIIADLHEAIARGLRFGCLYADPPWGYDNQATRAATGRHYKAGEDNDAAGMSVEQIAALPLGELAAPDAHLHLWTTNAFLFDCPKLFGAWGFEFRTSFVWLKPDMGIGNYWRNAHEILLTGVRGDAKRFNDHSMMSWLECGRGKHSAKPERVRDLIRRASPGPYLELFARQPAEGWQVWGNEVERGLLFHHLSPEAA